MSDTHNRVFMLFLMQLEGRPLSPAQKAELQAHLSDCPPCKASVQLHQMRHDQALRCRPEAPTPVVPEKDLPGKQQPAWLGWVKGLLRMVFWAGLAVLLLLLVQWVCTNLVPVPSALQPGGPKPAGLNSAAMQVPEAASATAAPTAYVEEAGKLPTFGSHPGAAFFGAFVTFEGNRLAVVQHFCKFLL